MRSFIRSAFALAIGVLILASAAQAQDLTISDELRARLIKFAEENPLAGGTKPEGWRYSLPDGITTAQVTWYSDDAACYAKMFYPRDFDPSGSYPGVVLGHGTNAITLAMEKYGPVFAEHGLVAMVIDYRTYGFSEGSVILQEPDTTTDEQRITEKVASVVIKRTRLLTPRQAEDYRNAISYLQGEPGVDPERIGIWGSSLSGGTVVTVANMDARVKAVVAQVAGGGAPRARRAPRAMSGAILEDAIKRARTGQGGEYDAGFSIRTKVDTETRQARSDLRNLGLMPKTTAVLFLPAEKDELIPLRGPKAGAEYYKDRGNPTAIVVIPAITHFQAYAGPPFEATSTLAARWFAHHLRAKD
ncbi:acetylxylan esterase [Candidatus Sumerlaeota bacterium]|nr:acetylxylan esterase [Candidatus Sumerlaeota bacterium]